MERLATGFGLIEGPVWDPDHGLYFSDVLNGGVFLLGPAGTVAPVVPKRRGVGGMALHQPGALVIGGRDIAVVDLASGDTKSLLALDAIVGATGFNDLATDKEGRIYVGSLAFKVFGGETPKPGHLHMIDLDGSMRTVSDGVMLTNGLGFSPDGRLLYHCDSRAPLIRVYDVKDDGTLGPWRKFAGFGDNGVPDGLKVATDGSVWVADAHGGRVAVFNADGTHRLNVAVPLPMVTSLCFGGPGLGTLYIVTGSRGGPHDNCGSVFVVDARKAFDVSGFPVPRSKVAV